jgi:hypothetical protein
MSGQSPSIKQTMALAAVLSLDERVALKSTVENSVQGLTRL